MNNYDSIIVGAGPIGAHCGQTIAQAGFRTIIFEKKPQIGIPVQCAGLVSPKVIKLANISSDKVILNKIQGAHFHAPNSATLTIGGNKTHAYVIDRTIFDRQIVDRAINHGAQLKTNSKITHVSQQVNEIICKTIKNDSKKYKTPLLIGADGPYSLIRDNFNFPKPKYFIHGIGAEINKIKIDPAYVHIFLGREYAPGFFAWIIPTNLQGTTARIGLCVSAKYKTSMKKCFQKLCSYKQIKYGKIVSRIGGTIPLGALNITSEDHVMVVGDAAAQVKPLSGGGLYPGLVCAKYCAAIGINALENNIFSKDSLKEYDRKWKADIGRELSQGLYFHRLLRRISDEVLAKLIDELNATEVIDVINSYGDIDHPSFLVKPLMKKQPSLLRYVPLIMARMFKN